MTDLVTSTMVISAMKHIFSKYGISPRVVGGNGPRYSNEAFKEFVQQWQFDHITSFPKFPRLNRFIEQQISKELRQGKQETILP